MLSDTDWANAWATAAVWNGESLVQVQVRDIAAELSWLRPTGESIHIRAVDVDLAASSMNLVADLANLRIKDTVR